MKGIVRIEVDFPLPVELSNEMQRGLMEAVGRICEDYNRAHPDRVMWPFGVGSKITRMPITAEEEAQFGIQFDDSVLHIEVAERERYADTFRPRAGRRRRRVQLIFAWYDFWVGWFWDRTKRRLYIFPVPTVGLMIDFGGRS